MNKEDNNFLLDMHAFKTVIDNLPLHVVITDPDGKIIYINPEVEKTTGYSPGEAIGQNPRLWGGLMEKSFYEDMWRVIKEKRKVFTATMKNRRKNGKEYFAAVRIAPIVDAFGKLKGFCGIEQDMTEIQKISDEFDIDEGKKTILQKTANVLKSR